MLSLTLRHSIDEYWYRPSASAKLKRCVEVLGGHIAFLRIEKYAIYSNLVGIGEAGHKELAANTTALD